MRSNTRTYRKPVSKLFVVRPLAWAMYAAGLFGLYMPTGRGRIVAPGLVEFVG